MTLKSRPDFAHEQRFSGIVCGIDEAGRAPLAGPVAAACVYAPESVRAAAFWNKVHDSKRLSPRLRESLAHEIKAHCAFGIAMASVPEIETLNILKASLLAMERACAAMCQDFGIVPVCALIDGTHAPKNIPCAAQTLIGGDSKSASIAAASILAKVARDFLMQTLAQSYPAYGWTQNAGYPTPAHIKALESHGITPHHRRTFAPVRAYIGDSGCVVRREN